MRIGATARRERRIRRSSIPIFIDTSTGASQTSATPLAARQEDLDG